MRTDPDVTRAVRSWLDEGVDRLPERVLDSVLDAVPSTPQRRSRWLARRLSPMPNLAKLLGAAAAIVLVALVGWQLLPSTRGVGAPAPTSSPTPTPTSSPSPSSPALHVADPFLMPFSIALPADYARTSQPVTPGEAQFDGSAGFIAMFLVQSVPDDPCHPPASEEPSSGSPSTAPGTPAPPSAEELVTALTHLTGFDAGPISSTTIDGLPAKAFTISNTIDTGTAGCDGGPMLPLFTTINGTSPATNGGATQQLWVVDAPERPVLIVVESGPEQRSVDDAVLSSIRFDR